MQLVDEAIRSWENARRGVLAELDNIPEDEWDYRPGPGARSVRELAYHIAESGVFFAEELLRLEGALAHFFDERARGQAMAQFPAAHSKADFLQLLRTAGEQGLQRLRQAGGELASQRMPTLGGEQSRLSALWFAVGHEGYHRGQIATYARGLGLVPVLTQQMTARQARGS